MTSLRSWKKNESNQQKTKQNQTKQKGKRVAASDDNGNN